MAISVAKFRARQAGILPPLESPFIARQRIKEGKDSGYTEQQAPIKPISLDVHARVSKLVQSDRGIEFKGDDFRSICDPGVYLFLHNDTPLYVGMSDNVVNRASSSHHHVRRAKQEATTVKLWPCVSKDAAVELEKVLIETLQPIYNIRLRHSRRSFDPVSYWLG